MYCRVPSLQINQKGFDDDICLFCGTSHKKLIAHLQNESHINVSNQNLSETVATDEIDFKRKVDAYYSTSTPMMLMPMPTNENQRLYLSLMETKMENNKQRNLTEAENAKQRNLTEAENAKHSIAMIASFTTLGVLIASGFRSAQIDSIARWIWSDLKTKIFGDPVEKKKAKRWFGLL